jgi:hypothetical protein
MLGRLLKGSGVEEAVLASGDTAILTETDSNDSKITV